MPALRLEPAGRAVYHPRRGDVLLLALCDLGALGATFVITTIQIGPIAYAVITVDDLSGPAGRRCGECDPWKSRIRLDGDMDPQLRAVALWHEIQHAILFGAGVPVEEHNEQHIDALAYGLVSLFRDNPDLLKLE